MAKADLHYLFNPRNICVIGASSKRNKVGAQVFSNLIAGKFEGTIYPINPTHDVLLERKAFKSVKEINEALDLAIITIPAANVPAAIEECVEENVQFAVIITAGFGEMGGYDPAGVSLHTELMKILKKGTLRVVGPNCMGIVSTRAKLMGLMGLGFPPARRKVNASIISQSGTWGVRSLRAGAVSNLGFSKFVSSGNELDLKFEDYLEYFGLEDPDSQIILGFIEGLRQGKRFIKLLAEIEKTLVFIKGGKTESGKLTAKSHTGSIAGSVKIYDAIFKQYGVIEARDMTEMVDYGRAFSLIYSSDNPKNVRGNRIGVFSGGGGACVLMADDAEEEGLVLAELEPTTVQKLSTILPPYWSHRNPVDLVATWDFGSYSKVLKILLEDQNVDVVVAMPPLGFSLMYESEDIQTYIRENPVSSISVPADMIKSFDLSIVREIGRLSKKSEKLVVIPLGFYSPENPKEYELVRELHKRDVLVVPSPRAAMRIIRKLWEFSKRKEQKKIQRKK
ncbi:MAG: acetyl-CoA synthetase [Promethearchaeota archaeon]|nr:MAG: acetyl-CoA synthetase [Candidatus Lokiarchaeota archaeon]